VDYFQIFVVVENFLDYHELMIDYAMIFVGLNIDPNHLVMPVQILHLTKKRQALKI
jgi:hypothetical protein